MRCGGVLCVCLLATACGRVAFDPRTDAEATAAQDASGPSVLGTIGGPGVQTLHALSVDPAGAITIGHHGAGPTRHGTGSIRCC